MELIAFELTKLKITVKTQTVLRILSWFILFLLCFCSNQVVAGLDRTDVKVFNRSMRALRYEVFGEFESCFNQQIRPNEFALHVFGKDTSEKCGGKSYYRFILKAEKRNGELLEGECILYPELFSRSVLVLWDGVRCFLKNQ